ncbi:D-alanine--D-alanine ligase [Alphaproteobacteria bacterium]|nr:D-alanine--D-alanine ligase [Alphaproteobacteria bacterium]
MTKILILQGGFNEEHKVSLNTSQEIVKAFKKLKIKFKTLTVNPITFQDDILEYSNDYLCFNALHGTFGEDGKIQKILKKNKFKVTHSNQSSSSNCFNKIKSKEIISKQNILTPKYDVIKIKDINEKYLRNIKIKFGKFILKPASSGSSNGLVIIKSNKDLLLFFKKLKKFKYIFKKNEKFLIEEYISGKELTVSVIKNQLNYKPLEVTEIVSLNKTYDYQAKYSKGFSKHFIPARITKLKHKQCLDLSLKIHKIFKCNTLSRVDFILSKKENKIYFLEINTQPGMTKLSLLPEQAKFKKISFEYIVKELINNSK